MTTTEDVQPDLGNTLPTLDSQISHADQISYWSSQSADVNGMLGGYPQVSRIDLQGSKNFIAKVRRLSRLSETPAHEGDQSQGSSSGKATASTVGGSATKQVNLAVDCGAGIGRITSGLLLDVAETVDIVEPVSKFTNELEKLQTKQGQGTVGQIFNEGLESWSPPTGRKYDLIWNQWCLGHLKDKQLIDYLRRAASALAANDQDDSNVAGWIMVKENLSTDTWGEDMFDDVDSSVTRSDQKFKQLFEDAGLDIVKMELQKGFPKSLYPVKMYALRPK